MAKKRKRPEEMTTEEIARRVFPKRVIEEVTREVSDSESPDEDKSTPNESLVAR